MINRACCQLMADCETGMSGPDNQGRDPNALPGQLTFTATFVGFVITSKTAERFCDWATSASIS
jgi:hypothetical protein